MAHSMFLPYRIECTCSSLGRRYRDWSNVSLRKSLADWRRPRNFHKNVLNVFWSQEECNSDAFHTKRPREGMFLKVSLILDAWRNFQWARTEQRKEVSKRRIQLKLIPPGFDTLNTKRWCPVRSFRNCSKYGSSYECYSWQNMFLGSYKRRRRRFQKSCVIVSEPTPNSEPILWNFRELFFFLWKTWIREENTIFNIKSSFEGIILLQQVLSSTKQSKSIQSVVLCFCCCGNAQTRIKSRIIWENAVVGWWGREI